MRGLAKKLDNLVQALDEVIHVQDEEYGWLLTSQPTMLEEDMETLSAAREIAAAWRLLRLNAHKEEGR